MNFSPACLDAVPIIRRSEYISAFAMLALFAIPLFWWTCCWRVSDQEYPFARARSVGDGDERRLQVIQF